MMEKRAQCSIRTVDTPALGALRLTRKGHVGQTARRWRITLLHAAIAQSSLDNSSIF